MSIHTFILVIIVFQSVVFVLEEEIDLLQQHMAILSSMSCKLCQLWPHLWMGNTSSKLRYTTNQLVSVIFNIFVTLLFTFYFEQYQQTNSFHCYLVIFKKRMVDLWPTILDTQPKVRLPWSVIPIPILMIDRIKGTLTLDGVSNCLITR